MPSPQLPARVDTELYHYLKYLRDRLSAVERRLGGGADSQIGTDDDVAVTLGFEPVDESPVVLAGTGEVISTEDAWTTLSSGAPAEARYAIIQFYMYSNDDDAGGKITRRTASGSPEIEAVIIRADGTSDADRAALAIHFVPLSSGSFDYKADTTAGDAEWQIRRVGYVM